MQAHTMEIRHNVQLHSLKHNIPQFQRDFNTKVGISRNETKTNVAKIFKDVLYIRYVFQSFFWSKKCPLTNEVTDHSLFCFTCWLRAVKPKINDTMIIDWLNINELKRYVDFPKVVSTSLFHRLKTQDKSVLATKCLKQNSEYPSFDDIIPPNYFFVGTPEEFWRWCRFHHAFERIQTEAFKETEVL